MSSPRRQANVLPPRETSPARSSVRAEGARTNRPSGIFQAEYGEIAGRPIPRLCHRCLGHRASGKQRAKFPSRTRRLPRIWVASIPPRLEQSPRPTGLNRVPERRKISSSRAVLECRYHTDCRVSTNGLDAVTRQQHEILLSAPRFNSEASDTSNIALLILRAVGR